MSAFLATAVPWLVAAAVAYAREKKVGILPLCPFAKSVFDRTPDYADVLR